MNGLTPTLKFLWTVEVMSDVCAGAPFRVAASGREWIHLLSSGVVAVSFYLFSSGVAPDPSVGSFAPSFWMTLRIESRCLVLENEEGLCLYQLNQETDNVVHRCEQ